MTNKPNYTGSYEDYYQAMLFYHLVCLSNYWNKSRFRQQDYINEQMQAIEKYQNLLTHYS